MPNLDPNTLVLGPLSQAANGAARAINFHKCRFRTEVLYASLTDQAGQSLQAANYYTFTLARIAAVGGAATTIATWTTNNTGGTALTAGVPAALTIIETSNANVVPAGDWLRFTITPATGTSAAMTDVVLDIDVASSVSTNHNN